MSTKNTNKLLQKGSLMVEALALLGLITMVTPVMYKKAAERTTELQDINVATQMRTLNAALDSYVRNNFSKMEDLFEDEDTIVANASDSDAPVVEGVKSYLPVGFDISQSKYFDASNIKFAIKRNVNVDLNGEEHNTYTSAVLAPALNPLRLNRASKIASMIGVNGGTIKNNKFEGTQGAWNADPQDWFNIDPTSLKLGSLMSISNEVIAQGASADSANLLYRVQAEDPIKNTMETNLFMDDAGIEGLTHLLGDGGNLYIGKKDDETKETNLIVRGTTQIAKALTIDSGGLTVKEGGITVEAGGATIAGDTTLDGKATVKETLGVTGATTLGSTLNVTGATTLDSTLNVTGDTTLANTSVGGTLGVTGATTLESTLNVTGATTLSKLTAGETDLASLAVTNDARVGGNLTIGGSLISNNLHAKNKLTVGGEDPDNPSVMMVDASTFNVENSAGSINLGSSNFTVSTTPNDNNDTTIELNAGDAAQLQLKDNGNIGTVKLTGNTGSLNIGEKIYNATNNRSHIAMGGKNGGEIGVTTDRLVTGKWRDSVYLKNFTVNDDNSVTENGSLVIDFDKLNLKHGATELKMQENSNGFDEVAISVHGKNILSSFADILNGSTTLASPSQKSNIELVTNQISAKSQSFKYTAPPATESDPSNTFYFDNYGLAMGENLTESRGNRDDPISNPLASNSAQKVIISRNGYIELVPPSDYGTSGANDGTKAGFIRARRLVSDIPYYTHDDFKGATYEGTEVEQEHRYDYYQVNPAYTSIMNDIKLASRGGARLSDILSDYVIKGIYVADNTYNAGFHMGAYIGFDSDGSLMDWPIPAEGLVWDDIKIENGKPVATFHTDEEGQTSCFGNEGCNIYSCQTADCVASPWMGFLPKPQCPPHYLAVITNNPIRWRMSEVYYLKEEKWKPDDPATAKTLKEQYNYIISDLYSGSEGSHPEENINTDDYRFSEYFQKYTDPQNAIFSIDEVTATADTPHTHKTSEKPPLTFQTNTWLNSSVSPHYTTNGDVDGWHILMGFLYKPTDYSQLFEDMGYHGSDPDAIHWNIFPVYAHEMASIVNTYCAFAPTYGNLWNSNDSKSPVLNYNQLDSNTYRDPNTLDREPVSGAGKGEGWAKQVNDPSLPYDDAW